MSHQKLPPIRILFYHLNHLIIHFDFTVAVMGQYYKAVIISEKDGKVIVLAWLDAYQFREGVKQMEHSYLDSNYVAHFEWLISPLGPYHVARVVWPGDYGAVEDGYDQNLYGLCSNDSSSIEVPDIFRVMGSYPLIVNHTKKVYVDKRKVVGEIHPLPLLTTETDSGGGGDYRGCNKHFLGIWARDELSMEAVAPQDFEEVAFKFME